MKASNIALALVIAGSVLSSCQKKIDETQYTYAISSTSFYNTADEANAAVLAPLNIMRDAYGANWFTTLEANTEYCYSKGAYAGWDKYTGIVNATHESRIVGDWTNLYKSIMYCNTAIGRLPKANAMTQAQIDGFMAEVRFIRALNYFNIVRHWGAAPLRTENNTTEWNLGKSSVADIYASIIADLQFAVTNAPNTPRLIGTPGKNAAKALLAEVYLYTKDYPQAKTLAGEVINSNAYSLVKVSTVRDFDKVFGYDLANSSEELFYVKTSRTDNRTWGYPGFTAHPQYEVIPGKKMLNGYGYFTHYTDTKNQVVANWDKNDLRYGLNIGAYIFGESTYGKNTALLIKYWDPNAVGDRGNVAIPLLRYTDVLITYAEASARVAGAPVAESIEAINKLRRRAYGADANAPNAAIDYKLADYPTMDAFIDLLIKEETYERMNEAKHWDFLVRLNKAAEIIGKYKNLNGTFMPIAEKHWLWKIPSAEFSYNKALDEKTDQNPGY